MRKKVGKYLFIGSVDDKDGFFERAQKAGVVQFIDPDPRGYAEAPPEVARLIQANKILRGLEPAHQEELDDIRAADRIAGKIVGLHDQIQTLREEERLLNQEIARIGVFGDFSLEDIAYLQSKGWTVQFFSAKHPAHLEDADDLIYLASDHDLDYFVSIAPERREYPHMTEMRIDRPLGELRRRLKGADRERHAAEAELKTYAKRKAFLEDALIDHLNRHHLLTAQDHVRYQLGDALFAVEGWVPEHKREELAKITHETTVHFEEILVEKKDFVPTFLENQKLARVGEDLVHIYDSPSTTDRDPSRWVLWFFAFFFSVILADAGYGLVLLAVSLWMGFKFGRKKGLAKRFATLCLILSVSAILWGSITTSFFGISIGPDNPLRKISLTSFLVDKKVEFVLDNPDGRIYQDWVSKYPALAQEKTVDGWIRTAKKQREGTVIYDLLDSFTNNIMLEFALLIGVIHLILSFLRVIDRNWAGIGWILFLIGGYLFFPSVLNATSLIHYVLGVPEAAGAADGLQLLYIGVGSAVILALIQHRLKGAFEIANIIQVFADSLSYLRLYALGLASAMMSTTFNDIGMQAGWIFGILIMIVGHSVNLTLSIVSGIIHGLRLNFLEWYRHCFDGGGRMLQPLRLLEYK